MTITWDEEKRASNVVKHGLDFADAPRLFASPMLVALDDRQDYGEDRWIGIGLIDGRVVVAVYTEDKDGNVRMISLRKALTHERKRYEEELRNQLGSG